MDFHSGFQLNIHIRLSKTRDRPSQSNRFTIKDLHIISFISFTTSYDSTLGNLHPVLKMAISFDLRDIKLRYFACGLFSERTYQIYQNILLCNFDS